MIHLDKFLSKYPFYTAEHSCLRLQGDTGETDVLGDCLPFSLWRFHQGRRESTATTDGPRISLGQHNSCLRPALLPAWSAWRGLLSTQPPGTQAGRESPFCRRIVWETWAPGPPGQRKRDWGVTHLFFCTQPGKASVTCSQSSLAGTSPTALPSCRGPEEHGGDIRRLGDPESTSRAKATCFS